MRPPLGLRHRITGKRPRPAEFVRPQARPQCQWSAGCTKRALRKIAAVWYCQLHARNVCDETPAVVSLAAYRDADVPVHYCGAMDQRCGEGTDPKRGCDSLNFALERVGQPPHFNLCCENGKLGHIPWPPPPTPPELESLLTVNGAKERAFRKHIRHYNTAFSFVSFGGGCFEGIVGGHGPPVVKCHGLVYHMAGRLFPDDPENPMYAQRYLYDHGEALDARLRGNPELNSRTMEVLQAMMDEVSPYVSRYRTMRSVVEQGGAVEATCRFVASEASDTRRYNRPPVAEPASVFVGDEGAPPADQDIVVWPHDHATHRVSELNEHVDPLAYPLLFPHGDQGWTPQLKHNPKIHTETYQRVTAMQFYSWRLMVREPSCPLPHAGGLLFQQYVCDMYSKAEAQRLAWVRMNQLKLRADDYAGLYDAVHGAKDQGKLSKIGKQIILPSSYPGCPRAMHQNYMDAMSIVCRHGKPDFFLTMTANPAWPEVVDNLRTGETAQGRPDLVARVFHMKFRAFMRDLVQNHVLGVVVAWTWVIEFQKRGLPHAHVLLIMRSADKPRTPADIDDRICAELPDESDPRQAELLRILLASQVHGPCGARNPGCVCMDANVCTKGYPKENCEETVLSDNGYPRYRRRESSQACRKGAHVVDARDVVPYNPYLSKKYACHLNVEHCGTVKAVKYLYKYTYKGHDRAELAFGVDELQEYVDARYVGPPESCWRLLGFHMHDKSHAVERLAVHEDRKQTVVFQEGQERESLEKATLAETTLLAWFAHNEKSEEHRHLRYAEMPDHFIWEKAKGRWKPRVRAGPAQRVIGRLFGAQPSEGERFYLYLLLLHVPGARGYEHLRTVDGKLRQTFREAAVAWGLVNSDDEYTFALEEAKACKMPGQMRRLFAYILVHCEVATPLTLWTKFQNDMSYVPSSGSLLR